MRNPTYSRRKKTALLLIDFINLFNFEGAEPLARRAVNAARQTAILKSQARAKRVPCIYINDNFGDWGRPFDRLVDECLARRGASATIAALLRPDRADVSILKPRHSAFYGTPLEFLLDELGVSELIITGISADNCIFATAQDAYVRQFKLRIPRRCVAADTALHERTALDHMQRTLKAVTD
jgi:nicotinamidase-related amidase